MDSVSILSKDKYLISDNVYDNFVSVHKSMNLLEPTPQNWEGLTVGRVQFFAPLTKCHVFLRVTKLFISDIEN